MANSINYLLNNNQLSRTYLRDCIYLCEDLMELLIRIKNIFGLPKVYPACSKSQLFTDLLGQSTLSQENINMIKLLGYTFKEVTNKTTIKL